MHFKGKNIHQVLEMTVEDAREFFRRYSSGCPQTADVNGCGSVLYSASASLPPPYLAVKPSGSKLSKELSKRDTGKTLYILDEPTTGLHFHDIEQLLAVLHRLRDQGNTVVVIEHNLDVIKTADWIVDLGPEGGSGGGQIIAEGTPEDVATIKGSHTGHFLKGMLK